MQVAGETVDEATLTQVLLAVLDYPDDPKAAQTQGVTISEVEAAAHYIVQRFGKSARKVAEQALREVRGSCMRTGCRPWWAHWAQGGLAEVVWAC